MAVKMTQQEWGTQKGWSPGYIPSKEEMAEYQAYLDAPVQEEDTSEQDASEQDLDLVDEDSKSDDGGITKNSLSIAQQRMRGLTNRPSYSDFEDLLGSFVNEDGNLSRKDRRDFRKLLKEKGIDMSRSQMRRIGRSFNRGETNGAFNNYVNGLERNSYIFLAYFSFQFLLLLVFHEQYVPLAKKILFLLEMALLLFPIS